MPLRIAIGSPALRALRTMPLFQYFAWVGGCLLAALFAASWCIPTPITAARPSNVPLHERINIRIHTDHKWPERIELDTTRSTLPPNVDQTADIGPSETQARAERQPFEAFAETSDSRVRQCFRPPCPGGHVVERDVSSTARSAQDRSRSRMAAHKVLTYPNQLHRPPGKS
jgi:hypothetical protein